ncbi:MAG: cyclic nucleotide-binding domain-containing protein [Proteobacteria bacterium]|nr:cyclic nucleotide-binding domain-containing protein [Pseudomonadota bacterium]HQR03988.1 cyclic nucleotide-binding domain-containing protein [Rhodocyclaceae bacterium]
MNTPDDILRWLGVLQPLAQLEPAKREILIPGIRILPRLRQKEMLRAAELPGDLLYLLKGEAKVERAEGGFDVFVGGKGRALHALGVQGEAYVVKPITEIELMAVNAELVDMMLTAQQSESGREEGEVTDTGVRNLLGRAFAALPGLGLDELAQHFTQVHAGSGEVILQQDSPGDYYYMIASGRCSVTRAVGGSVIPLAELKAGDTFGEDALVSDAPRNATVTMKSDGILWRMHRNDFITLLRHPLLHTLSVPDAQEQICTGAQWLDVRYPAEFQHDGLRGAINIPLNEIRGFLPALNADKEYVTYCNTGRRSAAAAFLMSQRGFSASLLAGGLSSLRRAESGGGSRP